MLKKNRGKIKKVALEKPWERSILMLETSIDGMQAMSMACKRCQWRASDVNGVQAMRMATQHNLK
jgi:hypothetical protein